MPEPFVHPADQEAWAKICQVEPVFTGLKRARDSIGLGDDVLLHAGPAFAEPEQISKPILNSAAVALVFEGRAADFNAAERLIRNGNVKMQPAQDFGVVTPLAAVVSSSMMLQVVIDARDAACRCLSPLSGGNGPAPRLGQRSDAALEHLRWLHGPFAGVFKAASEGDIALIPIAAAAIRKGDDCHGRTPAATAALVERIAPRFGSNGEAARALGFLRQSPMFFLNLWMGAAKCMLQAAVGIAGSSVVTAAGGNGVSMGIQVAGLPRRWFTAPAEPPHGKLGDGIPKSRALGAIGDSAIVDALGLGAMAMSYAPEQQKALGEFMPSGGSDLPKQVLIGEHPAFGDLHLRVGSAARRVVHFDRAPVVSLGILDIEGIAGRLGGGIYRSPIDVFRKAVMALGA